MRIELAGALAVGKSTLSAKLKARGFHVVFEDLSANPYLDLRKQDPEKYGLLVQQQFIEDKVGALEYAVAHGHESIVSDFSLTAELAYVDFYVAGKPEWLARLHRQVADSAARIGEPDLIVFMYCEPEIQLARIRTRGRDFEQGLDLGFIATINRMVRERVDAAEARGMRVIRIDAGSLTDRAEDFPAELSGSEFLPTAAKAFAA